MIINETDFRKQFGENLSRLRKENAMTQFQLAQKLNYSDKAVSKWERGESIPDAYTLFSIAGLFGTNVSELLGEETNKAAPQPEEQTLISHKNKTKITFIPFIAALGVFALGSIVFFVLKNIPEAAEYSWLSFLYTAPTVSIVLTVFSSMWWKLKYQCICVSALIWSTGFAVYFTFMSESFKYIFIPCATLECVCILVYLFVYFLFRKK